MTAMFLKGSSSSRSGLKIYVEFFIIPPEKLSLKAPRLRNPPLAVAGACSPGFTGMAYFLSMALFLPTLVRIIPATITPMATS